MDNINNKILNRIQKISNQLNSLEISSSSSYKVQQKLTSSNSNLLIEIYLFNK